MIGPWTIVIWCTYLAILASCVPVCAESFLNWLRRSRRTPVVVPDIAIGDIAYLNVGLGHHIHGLDAPRRDTSADKKSIAFLKEWLSPEQREQYERQNAFEVIGGDTGTRYRICAPAAFNIRVLNAEGTHVSNLCVVPKDATASGDILLAQKIALERNEAETLKVANRDTDMMRRFHNFNVEVRVT